MGNLVLKRWYDKIWLVVLFCIIFYPIGLILLWLNTEIRKKTKIVISCLILLLLVMVNFHIYMGIIYLFVGVLLIWLGISMIKFEKKQKDKLYEILSKYNLTHEFNSSGVNFIGVDETKCKIIVTGFEINDVIFKEISFDDILKVELKVDDSMILEKSTTNIVGRTIVGGIFGLGLLGGLTTKSKSKKTISNIELLITTKTLKNPLVKFKFFDSSVGVDLNNILVKNAIENAEKWYSIVSIIIENEK